ncbi:MAG: hypothetical protein HY676_05415 [Chloroflexi bacterium]|nr:hypothetical protein [Chloroflexota bacterium]
METKAEVHRLVKRMLGNEFLARDKDRVLSWVESRLDALQWNIRFPFEQAALKGRDRKEVEEELGIAGSTLRLRLSNACQVLGALARALPSRTFHCLFQSVYEHEFGDEVTARELTACLFGHYERRATQTVAVKWIPALKQGRIDLPMSRKKGKRWVWTREEAEAWRRWFAKGNPESEEANVR